MAARTEGPRKSILPPLPEREKEVKRRKCSKCDKWFHSVQFDIRLCTKCRKENEGVISRRYHSKYILGSVGKTPE